METVWLESNQVAKKIIIYISIIDNLCLKKQGTKDNFSSEKVKKDEYKGKQCKIVYFPSEKS